MIIFLSILFTILGFIIGVIFYKIKNKIKVLGTLKVDTSDPTKDRFLIDLDFDLIDIKKYDKILLKVKEVNDLKNNMPSEEKE